MRIAIRSETGESYTLKVGEEGISIATIGAEEIDPRSHNSPPMVQDLSSRTNPTEVCDLLGPNGARR